MDVLCERCGQIFFSDDNRNNGEVWYYGNLIGYACTDCQDKIWRQKEEMNRPEYIIIHHSWSPDNNILLDWEAIKKYHIEIRGWKNIGYHFGLEFVNNIVTVKRGRPVLEIGAHALGFNDRSIGVCVIGNYDNSPLQIEKKEKLVKLLCQLKYIFEIPTQNIIGHRDTYVLLNKPVEKTCPGTQIKLDELRSAVDFQYSNYI